ncbi:MAG: YbhB/YbcL family Raf kinase inhibitor-like protein [Alphaproteobacteria bacterium]|nr:YbhB/YbcL family Raf kinase inhibitor-like protein [Alphaproteobacteria bacterium]MCL2504873.1 YbhB/YbcL family Raf kinase inhibitor-like protein [Alphaproteobacteria bacterium]
MQISSSGIKDGKIDAKYGKHGSAKNKNGMPTYSLPLVIENPPDNTKTFVIVLEDKDAYPVTKGFTWIHWLAANLKRQELKENESQTAKDFVQGANSWTSIQGGSQSRELSSFYGGMAPPDTPHTYELHVFALDRELNLKNGFYLNELYKQMENHILAQATIKGVYDN